MVLSAVGLASLVSRVHARDARKTIRIGFTSAFVQAHPMFQGAQVRLMIMCPDCRQRAMAGVPG